MRWLTLSALVVLAGVSTLNWRAQLQTQQKLDALTAALAERPAAPVPPPQPAPQQTPQTPPPLVPAQEPGTFPRELSHVTLPPYIVEAPDTLQIEVVVKDPKTGKAERLPTQPISGSFLVRPDGTVGLGFWGSVPVAGLTLDQAAESIRAHLARREELSKSGVRVENITVIVDVVAYNSKRYYVITDGSGSGEQVTSFPLTGSETVLDAIAQTGGLVKVTNKSSIRITRKAKAGASDEVLPVDWVGITQQGVTATNYQLKAGDRIYVTMGK